MCGRISQPKLSAIQEIFIPDVIDVKEQPNLFNIAVGQTAYSIINAENKRTLTQMQFGVNLPSKFSFNARAEGFMNKDNSPLYQGAANLHQSPLYGELFKTMRCLIPVTSFIEGPEKEKLNKPFKINLNYVEVFAIAAIYGIDTKTQQHGFSVITTWPNEFIKTVVGHHRLPVILEQEYWNDWLDPESEPEDMATLLRPYHGDLMEAEALSSAYKSANYHLAYQEQSPLPTQSSLF